MASGLNKAQDGIRSLRHIQAADDAGLLEARRMKGIEHRYNRIGAATDQQAATGLGIGNQGALPIGGMVGDADMRPVAVPVAGRRAGDDILLRETDRLFDQRQILQLHLCGQARTTADFQKMAGQAEPGHIGHRMQSVQIGQGNPDTVELGGVADHLGIAGCVELALLQRGGQYPHAQRLAQHQDIARPGVRIAPDPIRVHQAQANQPIDGFKHVDAVAAGNRNARFTADAGAALEHAAYNLGRQLGNRHAHQRQRHDGRAAHGVDIGQGIGRRDATKIKRIVDYRREKIGGGNQRLIVVKPIDGSIIAGLGTHQQFRRHQALRRPCQNLGQQGGGNFATATSAMGKLGKRYGFHKSRDAVIVFGLAALCQFDSPASCNGTPMTHRPPVRVPDLPAFDTIIDARSPAEFALDHIPGAINCPVLDDEERRIVGTLYKQTGAFEARRVGGAMVAANLARHLRERFADQPENWKPLVYCWRGGLRSGSMVSWLRLVGWDAQPLAGGYKSFRHHVLAQLEALCPQLKLRIICGATGSAKTRILQALAARGEQTLDLEFCANHKGSLLGALPGVPQPSQKRFETLIATELQALDLTRAIYVEGESARIGRLSLPLPLVAQMRAAPCIEVQATTEARLAYLLRDYAYLGDDRAALATQLGMLTELQGKQTVQRWQQWAQQGDLPQLFAELMAMHYDPHYQKSQARHFHTWPQRKQVVAHDLSDEGIAALADAVANGGMP